MELASDWVRDGRRAGPLRNAALVAAACEARALGEVDCFAFPLGKSPGTFDCVRQLQQAGFVVQIHPAQKMLGREQELER
ncbi:MAG TPA: hypothetical protein VMF89_24030 [Polyangiales bacterium]|nr:hypothetical protein [Polyangiales bacterium]